VSRGSVIALYKEPGNIHMGFTEIGLKTANWVEMSKNVIVGSYKFVSEYYVSIKLLHNPRQCYFFENKSFAIELGSLCFDIKLSPHSHDFKIFLKLSMFCQHGGAS